RDLRATRPSLPRFLQHFALSSISHEPILYDHLEALFPSAELRNKAHQKGDKQLVRSANPTAAFILAERGAVTRCRGRFFSGSGTVIVTQQRIAFSRPLERPLFVSRCKGEVEKKLPTPSFLNSYM
ncbi:hypothetical protein GOODEAATRI_005293, partial [Goodea atripinnis]